MNWTLRSTKHKVRALGRVCMHLCQERPTGGKREESIMKKNIGVCLGMFAMSLGIVGAPAARAQSRMAAGETSGATGASTTNTSVAPAASSPADLDRRVEELEKELVELRTELASRKQTEETPAETPGLTLAQDKPADAKPPDKITLAGLLGPNTISGFVDVYYNYNSNHPFSNQVDACAFNCKSKTIGLNMSRMGL